MIYFGKIKKKYKVVKEQGLLWFLKAIYRKIFSLFLEAISLLCVAVILALRPVKKIKFVQLISFRIGHYALNTELMLCAMDVGDIKEKSKLIFYTTPDMPICNKQLHRMWKRVIRIFPFPKLISRIDLKLNIFLKESVIPITNGHMDIKYFENMNAGLDTRAYLSRTSPHLFFTKKEGRKGKKLLNDMGIPEGAKFICIHGRDKQYLKTHIPSNWDYHNYRDVDIDNYKETALFLADKGYYVVRVGKYVEKRFKVNHPRVIDYAGSNFRSDFLDIYLAAKCYFFVANSSGLDSVPQLFRKPVLVCNVATFFEVQTWDPVKLFLPKNLIHSKTKRIISFNETLRIFSSLLERKKIHYQILQENDLEFVENSPKEILAAVKEMLLLLEGKWEMLDRDHELQSVFWKNFPMNMKLDVNYPKHGKVDVKISPSFLRKYEALLE
ncbi:MAG: LA1599-like protein [uncultured bacterium]|nr:MAG: LA1599-like protein [uncultured bacterium]